MDRCGANLVNIYGQSEKAENLRGTEKVILCVKTAVALLKIKKIKCVENSDFLPPNRIIILLGITQLFLISKEE